MYAASWRLGSHRSRFHLCFWLFSGTIGQFSEASVLECTQQLWRPGSRPTHPSWRQFSKNNCIILTIFVQRPEISSFQKQRKIQNRPFCYICTMFSIWRFPKKKLRMTWPPTHLAISALCGGNVVTWWPLTKSFPFEIHFTQFQEYFFFTKKKDSNRLFIFNMICLKTHSKICVEKCQQCQLPTSLFAFSTKLSEHKFSISNSKVK